MKKKISLFIFALLILPCMLIFTACGNVEFKINFMVDNAIYYSINTSGNETLSLPDDPTKDGYIFDGWYWDNNVWQRPFTANSLLNEPLKNNMCVYAKWDTDNSPKGTQANFAGFTKEDETTYSISVSNTTETLNMSNIVQVSNTSSWKLTTDIQGTNIVPSKVATLNVGDNAYYILVTANNDDVCLYTLKIRRRPIYLVTFCTDGGTIVPSQVVEEGFLATKPIEAPQKKGYRFVNWLYNFEEPVYKSFEIKANYFKIDYSNMNLSLSCNNIVLDLSAENPTKIIIANITVSDELISKEVEVKYANEFIKIEKISYDNQTGDTCFEITPLKLSGKSFDINFSSKEGEKQSTLKITIIKSVKKISLSSDYARKLYIIENEEKELESLIRFYPSDTTQNKGVWKFKNKYDHQAEIINSKLLLTKKGTSDSIDLIFQSENSIISPIIVEIKVFNEVFFKLYNDNVLVDNTFVWDIDVEKLFNCRDSQKFLIRTNYFDDMEININQTNTFKIEVIHLEDENYIELTLKNSPKNDEILINCTFKNFDYLKTFKLKVTFNVVFKTENSVDLIKKITNTENNAIPSFDISQINNRTSNQDKLYYLEGVFTGQELDNSDLQVRVYDKDLKDVAIIGLQQEIKGNSFKFSNGRFITLKSGKYYIFITLINKYGNSLTIAYNIDVADTKAPVIEIEGNLSVVEVGEAIKLPTFKVSDESTIVSQGIRFIGDNNPSFSYIEGTNEFIAYETGIFTYEYYAEDNNGNKTVSGPYTIEAKDTQKPVITLDYNLNSQRTFPLEKDEEDKIKPIYLPDFTAEDVLNGIKEKKVIVKSPSGKELKVTYDEENGVYKFTPTVDGIYTVVYSATDNANNTTELTYTIKIGDNTAPSIKIENESANAPTEMKVNSSNLKLSLADIKVSDNGETKLASELISEYTNNGYKMFTVTVTGPDGSIISRVDDSGNEYEYKLTQTGKYTITYTARDKAGNEKIVKKIVEVYADGD